jgi:hypothetical protein
MKILALEKETPGHADDEYRPHLRNEAARVWELYQAGVVREAYFDQDRHTAVLVLECADAAEARRLLDSFPLVQAGLITFDLLPLAPYDGFARLFQRADPEYDKGASLKT